MSDHATISAVTLTVIGNSGAAVAIIGSLTGHLPEWSAAFAIAWVIYCFAKEALLLWRWRRAKRGKPQS